MQGVKEALKNHAEFAKETIKTSSKTKPLELAVREIESEKVQLQICSQLIKSGADVNEKGDEITALKGTVSRIPFENYNEKMDMLNRLLESGAKPDSDIVSFLLNNDNSNWGMQYYFTPQILKKLEKYDGKQNISQGLRAAMNGDDHKLQKLVISDKINKKDKEQVLAFAAAHCNVDTLKIMRKQGYDFSWKDSDKVGLLQIAALCNHSSVVKYLLEQQLNSKAKADYYKVRAVDFAIVAGNLDNAKILIEKDKVNFKKNHHGKPCDVWEFILAFGDKKSFKTLESLGHQPTKEEIYDTYQNYGKEQYEQGVKVKEDEVRQYSYDANGNQTDVKNTKTGQTESYTYDAENRLSKVSVTDKDGKTAVIQQNRYNGDGQRIQKVEGSKTTNYYYQDGVVSYTTDGENSQTSQNLIGTDGNILATQRYGSDHTDYLLYHKDIQGSTTSLVKEDGSADATYRYTDFGETAINGDNKAENEVCYTGGIYDQSTGLYYLNARYYNPEDARFLIEDTYRGENDKPDTQHLYVYCANNPINHVDPSGHYAVALYTLVKVVAGGVVFYVSYSTWKRRRIKTRYAGRRVTFKTRISIWLTWRAANRIMHSKGKGKKKKQSKMSEKEKSSDIPSWADGHNPKAGENGNAYAKREMDQRYGKGKWKRKGRQGHEYSELKKWADRGYRYKKKR